jgi:hypothetical protein
MAPHPPISFDATGKVRWQEMRCIRVWRLLQRIEEHAPRPRGRIEIKCVHCKVVSYRVGDEPHCIAS